MAGPRPKVLSVEDHELFRDGLRQTLSEIRPRVDLLEASRFAEAVRLLRDCEHEVALVLLDLQLPDGTGLGMLRALHEQFPLLPVAIVSGASEDPAAMRRALDQGAVGFVPKSLSRDVLKSAIQLILAGGTYAPAEALAATPDRATPRVAGLTSRQREIAELLAKGLTNKEIAGVLGISADTVKNHVAAILGALDVTNRTEAVRVLLDAGAVGLGSS